MIINAIPAIAECDGCGARDEAIEERNRKTQALTWAALPKGWRLDRVEGEEVHRCGDCVAAAVEPFGDRREAFAARLEDLGMGLVADISVSVGVPIGIGRSWAAAWQSKERERAAA